MRKQWKSYNATFSNDEESESNQTNSHYKKVYSS